MENDRAIIQTIIALHIWKEGFNGKPEGVRLGDLAATPADAGRSAAWATCLNLAEPLCKQVTQAGLRGS